MFNNNSTIGKKSNISKSVVSAIFKTRFAYLNVLMRNVEKVSLLDTVHPFILFLSCGGGDTVKGVVALHNTTVCLCLARFYHLVLVVRNVKLKAVLEKKKKELC